MPNPFPGMNPYMEDHRRWRSVHHRILNAIDSTLNRVLPKEFESSIDERVYIEGWGQEYYPDNAIIQTRPILPERGGTAVLSPPVDSGQFDAPLLLNFGSQTVREAFVEIRSVEENDELIAVIEVLSPTNKREGAGREDYKRKQRDLVNSLVHLVEIDLLRAGTYTVAPEEKRTREWAGKFDYIVSLHRGASGNVFEVWPITLRQRLPRIRIPLTDEAGEVYLDLQAIVNQAYDASSMDRRMPYDRDPEPPLIGEDAAWADALLREKGLR